MTATVPAKSNDPVPVKNQENQVTTGATGATVWLTGLPSAGKTTIAYELAGRLREEGDF